MRHCVGPADVVWSHQQYEPFLGTERQLNGGSSTLGGMSLACINTLDAREFFWLDYFCLRQCQKDFVPEVLVVLIGEVGLLYAQLDDQMDYLTRSFCIFELYAALKTKTTMHICPSADISQLWDYKKTEQSLKDMFQKKPCDAEKARTQKDTDKELIDRFILESVD